MTHLRFALLLTLACSGAATEDSGVANLPDGQTIDVPADGNTLVSDAGRTDGAVGTDARELDVNAPNSDAGTDDAGAVDTGPTPDTGPLAPSVLFADNFDSYPAMNISGRCLSPSDDDGCAEASFPWEGSGHTPGWSFLWTGGGDGGSFPYVAQITEAGARGGSGMNVQMWDENEHDLGRSQWGHDFQLAKYFESQHEEIWLQMYVYWSSPTLVTSNQKMTHMFHYDGEWLGSGRGFARTDRSTDGGVICNWRHENGNMEFRCGIRCSNPSDYQCRASQNGTEFASPDGGPWGGRSSRFAMLTGNECTTPSDGSYENVFANDRWHKFEVGIRMNSTAGTADGELELWFDDCRLGLVQNVAFQESGASPGISGFNGVTFGGNAQSNEWGPDGSDARTWQVDDVQICTERCP